MALPAEVKQLNKIPPIDYTSRDFKSIKADFIKGIPFFTPEWTDHNESDLGIVLADLLAHSADVLHFYLDRNANEAFLPTAITRRSVINLLKLIDFRMRSASPASVDLVFSITTTLSGNFTIPKGTVLQTAEDATGEPVYFETVDEGVILAGETAVGIKNGQPVSLVVTPLIGAIEGQSKEELLGQSDGTPNQRIKLQGNPVIDGTIEVLIDEGVGFELWTEVETFLDAVDVSKVFTTQRDENEFVTIFLGDGAQGKIPVAEADIKARFRIGGGARGNVAKNTIITVLTPLTFNAVPVALEVTNPNPASGGEERESIEEAKIQGPRSLRRMRRAVTADDLEGLAEQFPGVAKAKVILATGTVPDKELGCCCQVNMVIAPEGGGPPSSVLKNALLADINTQKMVGTCVAIIDPTYVPVDIAGKVFIASNFDSAAVEADYLGRLDGFFGLANEFIGFGSPVNLSDIYRLIDETPGVDHVDLGKVTRRVFVSKDLWPANGARFVSLTCPPGSEAECVDPGERAAENEVWTVTFSDPTTFNLRDGNGVIATTKQLGQAVAFADTGGRVAFRLDPGADPMCAGDRATFMTSRLLDNVPMGQIEIPVKGIVDLPSEGGASIARVCPK